MLGPLEVGQRGLAGEEDAGEVDSDRLVPVLRRDVDQRRGRPGDPCVVDEHVQDPARPGSNRHELVEMGEVGDVSDDELGQASRSDDRRAHGRERLATSSAEHHARALVSEAPRDRGADALSRAGDHRGLADEVVLGAVRAVRFGHAHSTPEPVRPRTNAGCTARNVMSIGSVTMTTDAKITFCGVT